MTFGAPASMKSPQGGELLMPAPAGLAEPRNGTKTEHRAKAEGRSTGGVLERVTVNLTPRSARALELATQLTGDSKTDVINRAIQVYAYLEHVSSNGGSVHTQKAEDSEPEVLKFF
jgi:hypothetical protein